MSSTNCFINMSEWKIMMLVPESTRQLKIEESKMIKKILSLFVLAFLISCNNSFDKIKSIDEINGKWQSSNQIIEISTENMTIKFGLDSIPMILTSRTYDRSKITVSTGPIMFFDAHVYINSDASKIRIDKINVDESAVYEKIK